MTRRGLLISDLPRNKRMKTERSEIEWKLYKVTKDLATKIHEFFHDKLSRTEDLLCAVVNFDSINTESDNLIQLTCYQDVSDKYFGIRFIVPSDDFDHIKAEFQKNQVETNLSLEQLFIFEEDIEEELDCVNPASS